MSGSRVVALVPARDEEARVGDTVRALASLPGVTEVVVVDDASADSTAPVALEAGATVLRIRSRAGKGSALEGALKRLPPADAWLFADGDLGSSAKGLGALLEKVLEGRADLAIAAFPPQAAGGFGIVRRASARSIKWLARYEASEPLSGQRAITSACLAACRPLARGFGLETAMTIDAVRAGFNVVEVPVAGLTHRPTGRSLRGFGHRGRQGRDILLATSARAVRLR